MKRYEKTFEFKVDEEKYSLVNTNPNEKQEAFTISKKEMQFDTNKFYQYVFSDINKEMEIEIIGSIVIKQQKEYTILFQKLLKE